MAPDLNGIAANGKIDYSEPGSSGYNIRQDATWMDPQNRRLRVLSIGAGVSGILTAYQIQKQCGNVEHVVYEKNADIAGKKATCFRSRGRLTDIVKGTWFENRYPG